MRILDFYLDEEDVLPEEYHVLDDLGDYEEIEEIPEVCF